MVVGVINCFYGLKLLIPILFIVSSLLGFTVSLLFFNEILVASTSGSFLFWIVVFLSIFCGCGIGYFAMIIPKYGIYNFKNRIFYAWSIFWNNYSNGL